MHQTLKKGKKKTFLKNMPTSILAHFSTLLQLDEKRFVYSFQLLCCIYHMLEREQKV